MARVRTRAPESTNDSRRLFEGSGTALERVQARRRIEEPIDLLRLVRWFALHGSRRMESQHWEVTKDDLLLRCAALDPRFRYVPPPSESGRVLDAKGKVGWRFGGGVQVMHLTSIEDEQQRRRGAAVARLWAILEGLKSPLDLTEAVRKDLLAAAAAFEASLVDRRLPLSPLGGAVWDLLVEQPEDRPLTGDAICRRLEARGVLCESTHLRHELSGPLRLKGVWNQPRLGYFIPSEFRNGGTA